MATDTLQAGSPAATQLTWQEALDAWQHALEAANRASENEDKVFKAYSALAPDDAELAAKVGKWFPYLPVRAMLHTADLEEEWQRFCAGENKVWYSREPKAQKAAFRAVLDAIAEFRKAHAAADVATGRSKFCDQYDKAWAAEYETRVTLMETPAPNGAAALAKLDMLFGPEEMDAEGGWSPSWSADYIGPALEDFRRLLAKVA